jgi:hypothetical protein
MINPDSLGLEQIGGDSRETPSEDEFLDDFVLTPEVHDLKKRLAVGGALLQRFLILA